MQVCTVVKKSNMIIVLERAVLGGTNCIVSVPSSRLTVFGYQAGLNCVSTYTLLLISVSSPSPCRSFLSLHPI